MTKAITHHCCAQVLADLWNRVFNHGPRNKHSFRPNQLILRQAHISWYRSTPPSSKPHIACALYGASASHFSTHLNSILSFHDTLTQWHIFVINEQYYVLLLWIEIVKQVSLKLCVNADEFCGSSLDMFCYKLWIIVVSTVVATNNGPKGFSSFGDFGIWNVVLSNSYGNCFNSDTKY